MSNDANHEYVGLARRLRRALRMGELTPEQAQAEYEAAEPVELSDATIDALVGNAFELETRAEKPAFEVTVWSPETDTSDVESDVYQLNRNEGELDPEVDELVEKHRREALDESSSGEDSADHLEDETGE